MSIEEWTGDGIPDEVSEQAAKWIAIFDSDEIDQLQWQFFSDWLEEDPIHRWAFEELSEIWARLETLGDSRHLLEESKLIDFPSPSGLYNKTSSTSNRWLSILSMIFIAVGLLTPFVKQAL